MKASILAPLFAVVVAAAPLWFAPAQAQQPQLSSTSQAWQEWKSRTPNPTASARRDATRESDERAAAVRAGSRAGARAGYESADAAGRHIAAVLGGAEDASETLSRIEALARDQGYGRVADAARQAREYLGRSGLVDPADRDYEPVEAPDGHPDVPASCEGNPACNECYAGALDKLDNTRYRLERLRAIYTSTNSEAKAKIAFADGVSGFHGMSALAWQRYKIDVMKSLKGLDRAYDSKYVELMEALLDNLKGIAQCEEQVMRVPDWYDRFGFTYYLFMKDRYKR